MLPSRLRPLLAIALMASGAGFAATLPAAAGAAPGTADDTPVLLTPKGEHEDGSEEAGFDKLRDAYYWSRLLSGDNQLTITEAAGLRSRAVKRADQIPKAAPPGTTRGGTWASQGPGVEQTPGISVIPCVLTTASPTPTAISSAAR